MHDDDNEEPEFNPPVGPPQPGVGYKASPESKRFKKGRSGNPKGRPKGSEGKRRIAEKVLLEEHEIVEGGVKKRYTVLELILIELRNQAFKGNNRAFKVLEKLYAYYDPQKPSVKADCLVVPGRLTKESWVRLYSPKNDPTQKGEVEDE